MENNSKQEYLKVSPEEIHFREIFPNIDYEILFTL